MFVNDFSGHYGSHWNTPGSYVGHQHNPYMYGWGTMPQNMYGLGGQLHGFGGQIPYFHNNWTQNTGWMHGQTMPHTMPQTMITNPIHSGLQGGFNYNHNTVPFTNTYMGQGYTPYFGNFNNNPFLGCR